MYVCNVFKSIIQFKCLLSPANQTGQRNQGKAARTDNQFKMPESR